MTGNTDNSSILSKIWDQLIQLFDISARIDAKTHELETNQRHFISIIDKISTEMDNLRNRVQANEIKLSNFMAVNEEQKIRRERKFNWLLSVVVLVLSTVCSYLLYLLGVRP
jgi:hypothetical protein